MRGVPHAETRVLSPVAALAALAASGLLALGVYASDLTAALAILLVGVVLALGWPHLMNLPSPAGVIRVLAFAAIALLVVTSFTEDERGLRWLPTAMGVAIIASFLHQLLRQDGRTRLVETLAGTALGLVILGSGAFFVAALDERFGRELVLATVCASALGVVVDLILHRFSTLSEWALPVSMALGAGSALAIAITQDVRWGALVLVGTVAAAVAHALRRLLTLQPSARGALSQIAVGTASVLVCGVLPYGVGWLFR